MKNLQETPSKKNGKNGSISAEGKKVISGIFTPSSIHQNGEKLRFSTVNSPSVPGSAPLACGRSLKKKYPSPVDRPRWAKGGPKREVLTPKKKNTPTPSTYLGEGNENTPTHPPTAQRKFLNQCPWENSKSCLPILGGVGVDHRGYFLKEPYKTLKTP